MFASAMLSRSTCAAIALMATACASAISQPAIPSPPEGLTPAPDAVLAASKPEEWRTLDPANTLYMDFPPASGKGGGRVIIELAVNFAPNHVANVKALAKEGYFQGGAVTRVQDNFVAQWAQAVEPPRPPKVGVEKLKREFVIPRAGPGAPGFTVLPDPDTYAAEVGFADDFPAARDADRMWLTHCYATVGVGREEDEDSGGGTELYAIIGHSPRNLDTQITVLGRVVQGMELLSSLPRGTGPAGFYEKPNQYVRYIDIRVAADVPEPERTPIEVLRTDSASFAALVNSRRWRKDGFYKNPAGRIGLCNVLLPSRVKR